jgi:hypothetical protein
MTFIFNILLYHRVKCDLYESLQSCGCLDIKDSLVAILGALKVVENPYFENLCFVILESGDKKTLFTGFPVIQFMFFYINIFLE